MGLPAIATICQVMYSHVNSGAGRRSIGCCCGGTGSPDLSWIFWVIAWWKHMETLGNTRLQWTVLEHDVKWRIVKASVGIGMDRAGTAGWSWSPRGSSANGPRTHQCNITNFPDMVRGSCLIFFIFFSYFSIFSLVNTQDRTTSHLVEFFFEHMKVYDGICEGILTDVIGLWRKVLLRVHKPFVLHIDCDFTVSQYRSMPVWSSLPGPGPARGVCAGLGGWARGVSSAGYSEYLRIHLISYDFICKAGSSYIFVPPSLHPSGGVIVVHPFLLGLWGPVVGGCAHATEGAHESKPEAEHGWAMLSPSEKVWQSLVPGTRWHKWEIARAIVYGRVWPPSQLSTIQYLSNLFTSHHIPPLRVTHGHTQLSRLSGRATRWGM